MTEVYLVTVGEKWEGGTVKGVFHTFRAARNFARQCVADSYQPQEWRRLTTTRWENGCDYVDIIEKEVRA
jgi:hypothetical protein